MAGEARGEPVWAALLGKGVARPIRVPKVGSPLSAEGVGSMRSVDPLRSQSQPEHPVAAPEPRSAPPSVWAYPLRMAASVDHVRRLIAQVDPTIEQRVLTGLSSGEGLIWAVRDPTSQDPGITDQRLLVIEPEFASVLKASAREISTLSLTLRSAWDSRLPEIHHGFEQHNRS